MLVLSRKLGEEIVIGDSIRVTIVDVRGQYVRLGFTAPDDVAIHRHELHAPQPQLEPSSASGGRPSPDSCCNGESRG